MAAAVLAYDGTAAIKQTRTQMSKITIPCLTKRGNPNDSLADIYATRRANDVDRLVATRVREARIASGFSQERLAGKLWLTFQQIQKYENAKNRLSVGRLYEIAQALEMPATKLLPDMESGFAPFKQPILSETELVIITTFRRLTARQQLSILEILTAIEP